VRSFTANSWRPSRIWRSMAWIRHPTISPKNKKNCSNKALNQRFFDKILQTQNLHPSNNQLLLPLKKPTMKHSSS
jgi:hypothetical protein